MSCVGRKKRKSWLVVDDDRNVTNAITNYIPEMHYAQYHYVCNAVQIVVQVGAGFA